MTRATFFKKPLFALGLGLLVLPLGAGDCQPPPQKGPCDPSNARTCEDDTICHPILLECVPNCARAGNECSGETPVCSFGENQLEDTRFNNVCICNDSSCPEDTVCHYGTHLCEETCDPEAEDACPKVSGQQWECYEYEGTGQNVCQPPRGACNAPGGSCEDSDFPICDESTGECVGRCDSDVKPKLECADTELCDQASGQCVPKCAPIGDVNAAGDVCTPSGVYETPCGDDECLPEGELCDVDTAADTFNQCVLANDVTGTCADADGHTQGDGGPIIYNVTFDDDKGADGGCSNVLAFTAEVYSKTAFDSSLYSQRLKLLDDGTPGLTYSNGGALHPDVTPVDGFPNEYLLTFYLCSTDASPFEFAIFLTNNNGDAGNAYCFVP